MSGSDIGERELELNQGPAGLSDWPDRTPTEPDGEVPIVTRIDSTSPDQSASGAEQDERSISIEQLQTEVFHSVRAGMALKDDIYDESDVLLLAAGSIITSRFLQLLRDRNIIRVQLKSPRLPPAPTTIAEPVQEHDQKTADRDDRIHTPHSRELDERMVELLQQPIEFHSVRTWRRPRLPVENLKTAANAGVESHRETSDAVAQFCQEISTGRRVTAATLRGSVDAFVDQVTLDFDLLPLIISLQESGDEYLYDHCVNVSLMAMAMACQLGLDRTATTEIGIGGLLQDIGMLRVPKEIRLANGSLTESDWKEIKLHPLHTLDMISELKGLPLSARLVAYQVHERIDGSGYPRGRKGDQIHRFAQIVSVADTFVAMTGARPFRSAISPYKSAKAVLEGGRDGEFDRELVRALLDTISLFPIGSLVGLSDGTTARVLRANPGQHTHPIVEEVTGDRYSLGNIIDLSENTDISIIRAY